MSVAESEMTAGARVLVVEDEPDLAATIAENLEAEGYTVSRAAGGRTALRLAREQPPDLVVLDVMLPELDGFDVCRALRQEGNQVPVLFLTARSEPDDRIRGLEEGGDDYMTKPFELRELLLRVAAILRRNRWYERDDVGAGRKVRFAGNEVDLASYRATDADGEVHELTHKEAMILKLLAEREGEVVSRDEILETVWGYGAYPSTRTVDNFILRLRQRFEPRPGDPRHFQTVHGVGYRFTRDPIVE